MTINIVLMGFCPRPWNISEEDMAGFVGAHPAVSGQHFAGHLERYDMELDSDKCNVSLLRLRDANYQIDDLIVIIFKDLPLNRDDDFEWVTTPEYEQVFSDTYFRVCRSFGIKSDTPSEHFFLPGKSVIIYSGAAAGIEAKMDGIRREGLRKQFQLVKK